LLNSCQWIINSKQGRRRWKWFFKVVGVLLSYYQIDPSSLLAWFLPDSCSDFAKTWKNDFLAFIIRPFPKFKLIQWWIKKLLQLEIKIQRLFNNLGLGSPQSLITLSLNIQIEVYKACKLLKLLDKSCLNFQHNPNSKTSNTLLWLFNHFFSSLHLISYSHLFLSCPPILSFSSCVVGNFSCIVLTSHASQFLCKWEREKPKNCFALQATFHLSRWTSCFGQWKCNNPFQFSLL